MLKKLESADGGLVIIGLVGRFCAGKNTFAEILEADFGFKNVSTRVFLKKHIQILNTEHESPQSIRAYANKRRDLFGAEDLLKEVLATTMATPNGDSTDDLIVISDIFCIGEAEYLQKKLGGILVSIECSEIETRWNRYEDRIYTTHVIGSLEEFKKNDLQDEDATSAGRPNIPGVALMADHVVKNNENLKNFQSQIFQLMQEYGLPRRMPSQSSETSELQSELGTANYKLEKFYEAYQFLKKWFTGETLELAPRNLAPIYNPSQSLDQFTNQLASRLIPIFLKSEGEIFDEYKKLSASTVDEELALLLNRNEFADLHEKLKKHMSEKEKDIRGNVRSNLELIRIQDRRQFLPEGLRNVSKLTASGITIKIYKQDIPILKEFQEMHASGKEPVLEGIKNARIAEVNGIGLSKISTVIHDVIDHVWLFDLLRRKGIFEKYSHLFASINEPHNHDVFQREGECIASIGFGVRLWANSKLGFSSNFSMQDIADHFHSCIDDQFELRHVVAFKEVVRLSKNPLSRESQSLSFVFSNYLVELDEQRRKHGEIMTQNLETKEIVKPLNPWDLDYLSFFVETHKELLTSKNRHRDHLLRAHILLEEFLWSPESLKGNPEITIFPTKLLQHSADPILMPPERVHWMARHFGFTAQRDPTI